ncbi:hypothetical protein DIS24_g1166 [Lasiodiplodia hormozganensis]|uniref:Uncharacterized protein n=1 Tax=Lasiodiplodia hormozganensis TaxID=869390 RepID=A0AA39Z593_9PEZI|nr:hypothetical protein DIS24_g1166 [Lasiodiplodia hormozganensis]
MALADSQPRRRAGLQDIEVIDTATGLLRPSNPRQRPVPDRIVRLGVGMSGGGSSSSPWRLAGLTHHRATPFDLDTHLWLLRHGEPDRWYARPTTAELERLSQLDEAVSGNSNSNPAVKELVSLLFAQLASKPAGGLMTTAAATNQLPGGSSAAVRPASADVVRVWAGAVLGAATPDGADGQQQDPCWCFPLGEGPADAHCAAGADRCDVRNKHRIADAYLKYYMVTEAPRAVENEAASGQQGAGWDRFPLPPPPPPPPAGRMMTGGVRGGGVSDEKVYRVEIAGSREACLARAYHNAALYGWSTVFCCVVQGGKEPSRAKPGLEGFERVRGLGALVANETGDGDNGKIKVFY